MLCKFSTKLNGVFGIEIIGEIAFNRAVRNGRIPIIVLFSGKIEVIIVAAEIYCGIRE